MSAEVVLKASVMVPDSADEHGSGSRSFDLSASILHGMDFILNGRKFLPEDARVSADPSTVHDVPIENNHFRTKSLG